MRAGQLDRTIIIQRVTSTVDPYGVVVESCLNIATLRAELVARKSTETIGVAGAISDGSITLKTRWLAGVTLADRISFEGTEYNVKALTEIGRRRALEIVAERLG